MWSITIMANAGMMGLFWLASLIAISMAHNRFVQYLKSGVSVALPLPTELAFSPNFGSE